MEPSPTNTFMCLILGFFYTLLPAEQTEICIFTVSILLIHSEFIWKQKTPLMSNT